MTSTHLTKKFFLLACTFSLFSLAACNMPSRATASPTLSVTQAYQTVEARLTEAISRTPTITATRPFVTSTPGPPSPSPTQASQSATPEATRLPGSCDQASPGIPIDVTIPDDTILRPGESFTKTWRLENSGTCSWNDDYALAWFSGEQLDASQVVPLTGNTDPGQSVDLSVDMVAPETPGTFQSWWKLRNPSGALFGIGPNYDSAFWVRIIVQGQPVGTGTPASTETNQPTLTPTVGVQVSGSASLEVGDLYDLDRNEVNAGGEDLTFEGSELQHNLVPVDNTGLAVAGPIQPSLETCQNINLNSAPVPVDNLAGTYLCYQSNMSLPGWLYVNAIDPENGILNVEIFTWLLP